MSAPLHTILGAHGAVGRALSAALRPTGVRLRQVSRTARAAQHGDEVRSADLLDATATTEAVDGASVAYLLAGLPYDAQLWAAQWPRVMANVIEACARHGTRLVFLDNVYMYGAVHGEMTEDTPFNPCSRKGEVRARIATMLLDAMRAQQVQAMIVRSADFYYPGTPGLTTGMLNAAVFDRLVAGKAPQWLGRTDVPHSMTYTPDIARSMVHLVSRDEAWGRTWHALTDAPALTGREMVDLACQLATRRASLQNAPRTMVRLLGLFNPVLREQVELLYQFEQPYRFSSRALEVFSGLRATPLADGFAAALGSRAAAA